MISNSWLDFGSDPDQNSDRGIFKGISTISIQGWFYEQKVVDKFL